MHQTSKTGPGCARTSCCTSLVATIWLYWSCCIGLCHAGVVVLVWLFLSSSTGLVPVICWFHQSSSTCPFPLVQFYWSSSPGLVPLVWFCWSNCIGPVVVVQVQRYRKQPLISGTKGFGEETAGASMFALLEIKTESDWFPCTEVNKYSKTPSGQAYKRCGSTSWPKCFESFCWSLHAHVSVRQSNDKYLVTSSCL